MVADDLSLAGPCGDAVEIKDVLEAHAIGEAIGLIRHQPDAWMTCFTSLSPPVMKRLMKRWFRYHRISRRQPPQRGEFVATSRLGNDCCSAATGDAVRIRGCTRRRRRNATVRALLR